MAIQVPDVLGTQFTGARAVFQLDGKFFAWGSGVDYGWNAQYQEYRPLNAYEAKEHIPESYSASFSCNQFFLIDRNLLTFGAQPKMGNTSQDNLINTIARGELNATVEDDLTEKLLLEVYGLRVSGCSFNIGQNSTVMGSVQFTCRRIVEFGN